MKRSIATLKQSVLLATSTAALLASAPSAFAQDGSLGLEEIIVTAQRRAESVQDIPVAVSAFGAADLDVRNIRNAIDLVGYIPNLFGSNNTGVSTANAYYLRGLGNSESIATFDPPVGTYVDDIYISRQNANNFSFFDMDRIEVLRGPQGTLFGRNTTGGAVNLILAEPDDELGGFAEASYGRFDRVTFRASIDAPIMEGLSAKLSGYYIDDAGYSFNYITNERVNDETSYGVRGAVKWTPNDLINWNVSASYINSAGTNVVNTPTDGDGISRQSASGVDVDPSLVDALGLNDNSFRTFLASGADVDLPRFSAGFTSREEGTGTLFQQLLAGQGAGNETKSLLIASNLELDFEAVNVELITGYLDLSQDFILNFFDGNLQFDPTSAPSASTFSIANEGEHTQFSQEVKFTGTVFDGLVDYVAGVYYLKEQNDTLLAQLFFAPQYNRLLSNDTEAFAGYAQLDWNITEQLTVTTGIRFTDETKDLAIQDQADSPTSFSTADLVAAGIPTELNASIWTPRVAIQYEVSDDVLLFASATRGFKSGAWNARDPLPVNLVNIDPEIVWSYEAGFKSQFMDDRIRLNVQAFYSDTTDLQTPSAFENSDGQTVFITGNFADLRVMGIEAEATAVINEYVTTFLTLGIQDADYKNVDASVDVLQASCSAALAEQGVAELFNSSGCQQSIVDSTGNIADPVRTPAVTLSFGANANYPIDGTSFKVVGSAFGIYTGSYSTATSGNVEGTQDSFWRANANIGVEDIDGAYGVYLECQNCFGAIWTESALAGLQYFSRPGSWTIRGKYNF